MSTTTMKTCPSCSLSVNATARYCKNCSFDFWTIPPPNADAAIDPRLVTSTPKSPRHFVIAGVVVAILVISTLSIWLYKKKSAANPPPAPVTPASSIVSNRAIQTEEKIFRNEALTDSDVSGLSANELRILRNVHFARYGRKYEKPGLGDYFYTRAWYQPRDDFSENMLTDLDRANIKVIQAAEDRTIATQSRNWETFWTILREAAERKDRGTLMRLMPSDFAWNCCDTQDENNNGDSRDDAFRVWSNTDVNGWEELVKALAGGAINQTKWPNTTNNRQETIAPPAANQDRYHGWLAICELREDGRWYFVTFLVPEADFE